jgi:hypothetical protein
MTKRPSFKAIEIRVTRDNLKKCGLWNVFWGWDIFINNIPFLKGVIFINIIIWIILGLING